MFEIGFSELLLIAIVTLLVFGPDKLPEVARTTGKWIARLKHQVNQLKTSFEKELQLDEFKKSLDTQQLMKLDRELKGQMSINPSKSNPSTFVTSSQNPTQNPLALNKHPTVNEMTSESNLDRPKGFVGPLMPNNTLKNHE